MLLGDVGSIIFKTSGTVFLTKVILLYGSCVYFRNWLRFQHTKNADVTMYIPSNIAEDGTTVYSAGEFAQKIFKYKTIVFKNWMILQIIQSMLRTSK